MLIAIFIVLLLLFCVKAAEVGLAVLRWVDRRPTRLERKNRKRAREIQARHDALMMEVEAYGMEKKERADEKR